MLKEECDQKGDEFTKEFITKFGADVKRIVTNNIRVVTEAFEKEQAMVPVLQFRQGQLAKAIEAINAHRASFEEKLGDLGSRKGGVEQKLGEAQSKLAEKEIELRLRRGE